MEVARVPESDPLANIQVGPPRYTSCPTGQDQNMGKGGGGKGGGKSGGKGPANGPSKTGNPSGGGRGNNPPKK